MDIRKFWFATLILISMPASAEFRTVELAYEVALSDMRVPVSSSGKLVFRQCKDCSYQTVQLNSNTQYIVNGHAVELKEFRKRVLTVRDRDAETIVVLHHLESNTISSLSVEI